MRPLIALALCFGVSPNAHAQLPFLRASNDSIVTEAGENYVLRGMGLGGWMLQEGYMMKTADFAPTQHQLRELIAELVGEDGAEAFYQDWRNAHFTEADLEKMHEAGFNHVRLPMHYNLFTLPIEEEPVPGGQTWLAEGFARTDSLIAWCRRRDMYVVLDLHAAPGGQGDDVAISDRDLDKPSLWESPANQTKTVALWRRLAERYADEPVVAGYDLINEVNYELPGNRALRELYGRITDTIRAVDTRHIVFIEGNGFANDFTGLTPPWDDNLVYSPHKYWNYNTPEALSFATDLRAQYNVPLYLGETGENSNVWFADAVELFESHNIGYAWWPWKKIDDRAGPVSIPLNPGYQRLLDYWGGDGERPTAAEATAALKQLTEDAELANARFLPDVTHALLTEPFDPAPVPYRGAPHAIPGEIMSVDFDMGGLGVAYHDNDVANYWVSTGGDWTPWNRGFAYRNDAVDVEASEDDQLTNGYSVGWTEDGEWLQYTVDVAEPGIYTARVRTASGADGGRLHLASGENPLTETTSTGGTGGWQDWQTTVVTGIPLTAEDEHLRLYVDQGGFNVGGMAFAKTGELSSVATAFVTGVAREGDAVTVTFNKPLTAGGLDAADFRLLVNGEAVELTGATLSSEGPRAIRLTTDAGLRARDELCVTYVGEGLRAVDGTPLQTFDCAPVINIIAEAYGIPGTLQAEDFYAMSGVELEDSGDAGGTQNIGFLDVGDYLDYSVDVTEAGTYAVSYRTASLNSEGGLTLQLLGEGDETTDLQTTSFPVTGGWQDYETTEGGTVTLPAGLQRLRLLVTQPQFNVNYLTFATASSVAKGAPPLRLTVQPNPTTGDVRVSGELPNAQACEISLIDAAGRRVSQAEFGPADRLDVALGVGDLAAGVYVLRVEGGEGGTFATQVVRE